MKRRPELGVTLIDLTVAMVVTVVVIGLAYPGFKIANDTISTSGARDRLERAGDRILGRIVLEARTARVLDITAPPLDPSVTLRQPREDADLADLSATPTVPWSATDLVVRFQRTGIVRESEEGEDINGDGDRVDRFALGFVEFVEDGRATRVNQTTQVLAPDGLGEADLDGDGAPDPLFSLANGVFRVELHLFARTDTGRLITTTTGTRVRLRNPQD